MLMNNLLITGATTKARLDFALNLTKTWLCLNIVDDKPCQNCRNCLRVAHKSHPNLNIIEPQNSDDHEGVDEDSEKVSDIKIEQIRKLIIENQKTNFEPGPAIFIITHIHQMTKAAANALLKSIEESFSNKVFLGLAPSKSAVLGTIASRLVSCPIKPEPWQCPEQLSYAEKILEICRTPKNQRLKFWHIFSDSKLELVTELEEMREQSHSLLRIFLFSPHETYSGLDPKIVEKLSEALTNASALLRRNINPRMVIEEMLFYHWPQI